MVITFIGSENQSFHYKYQVTKNIKNSDHQYCISFFKSLMGKSEGEMGAFVSLVVCTNFAKEYQKI